MRVQDFERHIAFVTDPAELIEQWPCLKVSLAGKDPVGIGRKLARGSREVTKLNPAQDLGSEENEVLELARPGVIVEEV